MKNNTQQTTSQNGYMIRLEVLKMAVGMVEQEYNLQREAVRAQWDADVELARQKVSNGYHNVVVPAMPKVPDFPSPNDIKNKAAELYQFITTK